MSDDASRLLTMGLIGLGLAHELATPLTTTALGLELLEHRLSSEAPQDPTALCLEIARLRDGVERMSALVGRFRAIATGRATERRQVDLGEIAQVAVGLARPAAPVIRDANITLAPSTGAALALVDRVLAEQAALCLVVNAMESVGAAGRPVQVVVGVIAAGRERGPVLFVEDDGPGLPEGLVTGQVGFSTKGGRGMGVGVALAARLAEESGGALSFVSAAGRGTRAEIVYPALAATSGTVEEPQS